MSKEPNRNVYVGHRYVPLIMGEWDKQQSYEGLSVVLYEGGSYTSKGYVPAGIDIKNEKYWALTGNYNAQVENYRNEVSLFDSRINENKQLSEKNESDITSHNTRINANKQLGEKNESDISSHDSRINKNESDITSHNTRINANKQLSEKNESDISSHNTRINTNKQLSEKNESDITSHNTRINTIKDDLLQRSINPLLPPYNADGTGQTDATNSLQQAINDLESIGGGTLLIPDNATFLMVASEPTILDPKRIKITGENIHIVGNGTIKMSGINKNYLDSIDDIYSSGRDVFTVFSFIGAKNCSVRNVNFIGEWFGDDGFRYKSPRCKAVGFTGSEDCHVENIHGENLYGNVVNANNSQFDVEGFFKISKRIRILNSTAINCLENGFNFMGGTENCLITNSYAYGCTSTGFESASDGLICTDNIFKNNIAAGMAFSGKDQHIKSNVVKYNGNGINLTYVDDSTTGHTILSENIINSNKRKAVYIYPGVKDILISSNYIENNNTNKKDFSDDSIIYAVGTPERDIKRIKIIDNVFKDDSNNIVNSINLSNVNGFEVKNNTNTTNADSFVAGSSLVSNGIVLNNETNVRSLISTSARNIYNVNQKRSGTFTGDGSGTNNPVYIPHNLNRTPREYHVTPGSKDVGDAKIKYVLADATQLIVYFDSLVPEGVGNVTLKWQASN